jgi:hypothetical protein
MSVKRAVTHDCNSHGFKIEGSVSGRPTYITVGEIISDGSTYCGLLVIDCDYVAIGSYVGHDNGYPPDLVQPGGYPDVWLDGTYLAIDSIESIDSKDVGVVMRPTLDNSSIGSITVKNSTRDALNISFLSAAVSNRIGSAILRDAGWTSLRINGDVATGRLQIGAYASSGWAPTEYDIFFSSTTTYPLVRIGTGYPVGDSTGAPGDAVVGNQAGRSAIASTASDATISTPFCTATSIVTVNQEVFDATLTRFRVTPAAGSFTVEGNAAATNDWPFSWSISGD